jgi:hypothetical protein
MRDGWAGATAGKCGFLRIDGRGFVVVTDSVMDSAPLTPETQLRVELLFPPAMRAEVVRLLIDECGRNLPLTEKWSEDGFERIRFGVLRLSGGTIEGLGKAIELAKRDWRDVLMAAGFANSTGMHRAWMPEENAR